MKDKGISLLMEIYIQELRSETCRKEKDNVETRQRKNTTAAGVVHSGLEGMKWLNPNYGSQYYFWEVIFICDKVFMFETDRQLALFRLNN